MLVVGGNGIGQPNMYNMQKSYSPPSVRNKIQMHKLSKGSNVKNNNGKKVAIGSGGQGGERGHPF